MLEMDGGKVLIKQVKRAFFLLHMWRKLKEANLQQCLHHLCQKHSQIPHNSGAWSMTRGAVRVTNISNNSN
jgi:hypothetical protein